MCFCYLLLGHLIGDFTLQTNSIAMRKAKRTMWIIFHSLIVTFSMLVFSVPFGYTIMFLVILSGVFHFFIDAYKARLFTDKPSTALIYFILDQGAHILIIFFISTFSKENYNTPIEKENFFLTLCFIFVLSFSSVCIQYLLKLICKIASKDFYINNEKAIGNITRITIFITLVLAYYYSLAVLIILLLGFITLLIYYKQILYKWMNKKYFFVKIFLDMSFSIIGFILFLFLNK